MERRRFGDVERQYRDGDEIERPEERDLGKKVCKERERE